MTSAPVSWSSGNAFVSQAGGLRFKSPTSQIGHKVANSSPPRLHFFKRSYFVRRRNDAEMAPQTRYTLRRNTACIVKDLS